ncbi:MAG: hypothetical protein GDA36_13535 [Rhodobacteraceae bacterium]|nr:hypothetical protein [Paracoccaceae bacterium]
MHRGDTQNLTRFTETDHIHWTRWRDRLIKMIGYFALDPDGTLGFNGKIL